MKSIVSEYELISPEFALTELYKHKEEILFESRIGGSEFNELMKLLSTFVKFIKTLEYVEFIEEAKSLFPGHLKDVDFFAIALKLDCPLWSNEVLHKKQPRVEVFNTDELRKILKTSNDKHDSKAEENS